MRRRKASIHAGVVIITMTFLWRRSIASSFVVLGPHLFLLSFLFTTTPTTTIVRAQQTFDAANAAQVINKMKLDVIELGREVERIYNQSNRCNVSTFLACNHSNYDACRSTSPNPTCPTGVRFTYSGCGNGKTCSSLWDFSHSQVIVVNDQKSTITDPFILEGVCVTQQLDSFLAKKAMIDAPFWAGYGIPIPTVYFGGQAGFIRYYPIQIRKSCIGFDPRQRPWYAAGSSGPKNIILLLDISESMNDKFALLQKMIHTIIDKLSVGDRIAIITMNETSNLLGPITTGGINDNDELNTSIKSRKGIMFTASSTNKQKLRTMVDSLSSGAGGGKMNLSLGLNKAFDSLEASVKDGSAVTCHTALLIITGSTHNDTTISRTKDTVNDTDDKLIQLIQNRSNELSRVVGGKIILFTYNIMTQTGSSSNNNNHITTSAPSLMSKIACAVDYGVWNQISNTDDISKALESYYLLFALGLGNSEENRNFIAWVEPYTFSRTGMLGTTVSVPVYDRSQYPHIFLGVAGLDLPLSALDIVLGSVGDSNVSVARIVGASTAICPKLELNPCLLESIRRYSTSGEQALCGKWNCANQSRLHVQQEKCPMSNNTQYAQQYPTNLWANLAVDNVSYLERGCCKVGENKSSKVCAVGSVTSDVVRRRTRGIAWATVLYGLAIVPLWVGV